MKKKLLVLLFSLATLGLVSCGGGNDGASTGTPVVAQATIWTPTANGGCGNSWSYDGNGPPLNPTQQTACTNASNTANQTQCSALGGQWWPASGGCSGGYAWFPVTSQQQCTEYGGGWSNPSAAFCLI
jgi:hypothetical protein